MSPCRRIERLEEELIHDAASMEPKQGETLIHDAASAGQKTPGETLCHREVTTGM